MYAPYMALTFEGYNYLNTNYTDSVASAKAIAKAHQLLIVRSAWIITATHSPIIEYAKAQDFSTGIVSTVCINVTFNASCLWAQNASRCKTPEIGSDMLTNGYADLIMGARHPLFDENGVSVFEPNYAYITADTWNQQQNVTLIPQGSQKA